MRLDRPCRNSRACGCIRGIRVPSDTIDLQTGNGGLFAQYFNSFLKLKAEAGVYPSWVQCPEDEDRYISFFNNSEGMQLYKDAIGPNHAKGVWPDCA